ncbi:sterol desaturase family protein [Porticoccus sp. W117]|uniref:sterol desaturase family protein n=1 Tax=Porticoccus sp. W117 TaxID=3054777 RepID=UPI0025943FD3|nr:sterol desaturase family protein [Porticoccus sp. W117]MDM3870718.1 sterol desaturase family protein [Porticoccus sp. W117]
MPRTRRWLTNWGLVIIDALTLRVVFPILAVGVAVIASQKGWGLFNILALPLWLEITLAVVLLDLLIYAQHVLSHKVPLLWRLHKVHHVDRDIDVTTGARFHPLEILFSMVYKMLCVLLVGPAAAAVILFEVILNGSAMFNHANVRLPKKLDALLRSVIITPDMHRVHHSVIAGETDSNYGFFLSCWDRWFGTYVEEPRDGHDGMTIGLAVYQDNRPASLWWSLLLPFKPVRRSRVTGNE